MKTHTRTNTHGDGQMGDGDLPRTREGRKGKNVRGRRGEGDGM